MNPNDFKQLVEAIPQSEILGAPEEKVILRYRNRMHGGDSLVKHSDGTYEWTREEARDYIKKYRTMTNHVWAEDNRGNQVDVEGVL